MRDVAAASAGCEARYRVEFNRWSSMRAEEQQTGEVGAAAAEAAGLFLGEMEGQLAGAMGAAAVGEAALGPEEAGAMDIVVRRPRSRAQRKAADREARRRMRRRLSGVD